MEKYVFKQLTTEQEINSFIEKVRNYTGVQLPLPYATGSKIIGVFRYGSMVAGYMLVTRPGFRSLLFVPDSIKTGNDFFRKDTYEMMEVNGLWIGPGVKTPRAQLTIWLHLIRDIFMCRKKYLLLMSDSRNRTIHHIHSLTRPVPLYEGSPQLFSEERTHDSIKVSYTTRWKLIINLPRYLLEYRNRQKRARNQVDRKPVPQS